MVILPIGVGLLVIMLIGGGKAAVAEMLLVMVIGSLVYIMCAAMDKHFANMVLIVVILLCLQIFSGSTMPLIEKLSHWLAK